MVRQGGNTIYVRYVKNIFNDEGKVIKKGLKGKMLMHVSDIRVVDYYYDKDYKIDPKKCSIFHQEIGWMILHEAHEDIYQAKLDGAIVITGFQQKLKRKIQTNKTKKP
tara:strand:+ start:7633 stop:7956 length:324 start_codon:yes stop_codon:yes gene_type:complete